MKIAHLILAHTAPQQLERLVKRLRHTDAYFFIHIDAKSDIKPFKYLSDIHNVRFVNKRVRVYWGGYSQVQASINGFKEIMASGIEFDYVNLLSGMDYPIKSTSYIHDFLTDNPGKVFMHCVPIMEQWKEAASRITGYHLANVNFPGKYKAEHIINKLMPSRSLRGGMVAAGRSQWFTASAASIKYIIDYVNNNPWIARFFKLSWGADEIMFHTILYNSPFREAIQSDNLTYTDWTRGGASPKLLSTDDLRELQQTDKLFARKFDERKEGYVMDLLDHMHGAERAIKLMPYKQPLAV